MSTDLPLTLTVAEAATVLRIGRTSAYNLVRCGRLRSIRCGKIIRIPREAIFEFLNSYKFWGERDKFLSPLCFTIYL